MFKKPFLQGLLLYVLTLPAQAAIVVSVNTNTQQVSTDDIVDFTIDISGLDGNLALGSYELSIGFDPALLQFNSAAFGDPLLGDQLDLAGLGLNVPSALAGVDSVNLIEFSLDDPATLTAQQADFFRLATLSFLALAEGNGLLTVSANSLSDADANALFADTQNAPLTIANAVNTVPEPSEIALIALSGLGFLLVRKYKHLKTILQS